MLEAPLLKPLAREDQFKASLEPPKIVLPDDLIAQTARSTASGEFQFADPIAESTREDRERLSKEMDGSSFRIQKEIWNDRLKSQERRAAICSNLVGDHIQGYVLQKEQEAAGGELSVGRIYAIRLHLFHVRDWVGSDTSITEIDGPKLRDYHSNLLGKVQRSPKQTNPKACQDKSVCGLRRPLANSRSGRNHVRKLCRFFPPLEVGRT